MILYLKECCEVWEKIWTNKVWALSLNSCVWSNGKWDLVDLSGDSFLQWQTWDKHFNIPNIYSDTSQHLLDSDFKSTSNFLIVHHFPLRINHWSPFQISSPSSVFFQSFSHWFLLRSALFVLAEVIDPPSDGIERVDDVRGWMSDSRSLALVSPIERILLAEFLLFPGVLQSVANPCNYNHGFHHPEIRDLPYVGQVESPSSLPSSPYRSCQSSSHFAVSILASLEISI